MSGGHGYLTPDSIDDVNVLRLVSLSRDIFIQAALTGQVADLSLPDCWQQFGAVTPDAVAEYMFGRWLEYIDLSLCGVILPYITTDPPVFGLACDGATYNRVDYPRLYAVLDAAFIVDADTFFVPDLRGRVMLGSGGVFDVGDTGGEAEHTLTIGEMPTHDHADLGHTHSEIAAIDTLVNGGLEAPSPSAAVVVATTGTGFANIQTTGGGDPHNNMQPFLAVKYFIVAQ